MAERRAHDDRDTLATTLLAHLCLNCLLSARLRREAYIGSWLPPRCSRPQPIAPDADVPVGDQAAGELGAH